MDAPLVVYFSLAVAVWIIAFRKWSVFKRFGTKDRRVSSVWLFIFFVASSVTLKAQPVYFAIDRLIGINNLALLLSYLCVVAGVYFLVVVRSEADKLPVPRWAQGLVVVETLFLLLFFWSTIHKQPEAADHTVPQSTSMYIFMMSLYLYTVVMMLNPFFGLLGLYRRDGTLPARLRIGMFLAATASGTGLFLAKIFFTTIGLLAPASPLIGFSSAIFSMFMVMPCTALVLGLSSSTRFAEAATHIEELTKKRRLRNLLFLEAALKEFCPAVATIENAASKEHPTLQDRIEELDQRTRLVLVYILDARKMLAEHRDNSQAQELFNALQSPALAHEREFAPLAEACSQISKQVRRQRLYARYKNTARSIRTIFTRQHGSGTEKPAPVSRPDHAAVWRRGTVSSRPLEKYFSNESS